MPSVTRKRQSSRADRREDVRGRLLTAIEDMLHEGESFTELSVERIVATAGISRSTFYVYFEDKGDLLRALTEDVISQMLEVSHHWWDLEDPDPEKLHEALSELVEAYRKHRTLLGAMTDTSTYDEGVRAELHEMMRTAQRELAAHLRNGQRSGFVRADLDPTSTAAWVTSMVDRGFYDMVGSAPSTSVGRMTDALSDIVWHALYVAHD